MKKIIDAILADKWLKLLALGLAGVTWWYVAPRTYGTDERPVTLDFKAPKGHFILAKPWTQVQVELQGPADDIDQMKGAHLVAEINLAEKLGKDFPKDFDVPRSVSVRLAPSDIRNLPPRVRVKEFKREEISVLLDEISEKLLPVEIDQEEHLQIKVREGFEVYRVYSSPKRVFVRGPRSVLEKMESIRLERAEVPDLADTFEDRFPLRTTALTGAGDVDCLAPRVPDILVRITVIPKREKVKIKKVPVEVRGWPDIVYTVLKPDMTGPYTEVPEVEIQGPKKTLDDDPKVRAFVDLTDITDPGEKPEAKREVQFSAAEGVEVLGERPTVMVKIKAAATKSEAPPP